MNQESLRELLARVHERLSQAGGSVDPESRSLLSTVMRDIERTLGNGDVPAPGVPAATPVLTLGFVQPFPPYRVGSKLDITIRVTNHSNSPVSTAYVKFAFSGNVSFASYVSPADPEWLCNGSQLCSMTVLNPVDVVPANGGTAQAVL